MDSTLRLLVHHEAGPEESARFAASLVGAIAHTDHLRASPETRPAREGERAIEVPLAGQLALTFLSGGAATALINLLAARLPKRGETTVELKLADGSALTLSGPDLTPEKTAAFVKALRKFEPPER